MQCFFFFNNLACSPLDSINVFFLCALEVEWPNNMTVYWFQIERSGFEPWLGSLCCVFG